MTLAARQRARARRRDHHRIVGAQIGGREAQVEAILAGGPRHLATQASVRRDAPDDGQAREPLLSKCPARASECAAGLPGRPLPCGCRTAKLTYFVA